MTIDPGLHDLGKGLQLAAVVLVAVLEGRRSVSVLHEENVDVVLPVVTLEQDIMGRSPDETSLSLCSREYEVEPIMKSLARGPISSSVEGFRVTPEHVPPRTEARVFSRPLGTEEPVSCATEGEQSCVELRPGDTSEAGVYAQETRGESTA